MLADQRVGNTQRDHVLGLLGRALTEGYLSAAEYEDRVVAASASQREAELFAQLQDLPSQFLWQPGMPVPQPERDSTGRGMSYATLVLGMLSVPLGLIIIGAVPAVGGVILSLASNASDRRLRSFGFVGRMLSLVGLVISVLMLVLVIAAA
jgi:hypothetical protein